MNANTLEDAVARAQAREERESLRANQDVQSYHLVSQFSHLLCLSSSAPAVRSQSSHLHAHAPIAHSSQ